MSKSATEQFQIKKKRKHPLSGSTTAPLKKPYKRHINSVSSSSLSSSTAAATAAVATADLLIKENYTEFQIDNKESTKFNTLLQIKSLAGAVAAAAAATAAATLDNLSEAKKCIITSTAATTTAIAKPIPIVTVKNCLRDQSQVLILNTPVNMPLSHEFYVKGALATKRGLKALKTNATSGSPSVASCADAKRPRWSNENLKLHSPCFTTQQQKTTNNLQLSYMLGESLARHGRLQEAFDIYAFIASEQPEGFIPLEKLNILATALLEYIRILSSSSKKTADITDAECIKALSSEQQKLVTPIRSKYASSTTSGVHNWSMPATGLLKQSSKLKDLDADFLASAVGGNLDLHSPTRELTGGNNGTNVEDYDPLMCPLCRDVLRCPVTTNCGHTFCRQCCETITMCNICHIKFPRWQKDDSYCSSNSSYNHLNIVNSNKLQNFSTSLASLSTATTTTTSMDLATSYSNLSFNNSQQMYSSISPFTTSLSSFTSSTSMSSSLSSPSSLPSSSTASSSSTSLATINEMPRLQIITTPFPPSPTTVTTTTIACTTDTATTTMASTSAISGGLAFRSSSSNDNFKFMPDVLVRRLVEKWWGADLKVKKINETATSYMHLNLLDDALKFCNASLEKCKSN